MLLTQTTLTFTCFSFLCKVRLPVRDAVVLLLLDVPWLCCLLLVWTQWCAHKLLAEFENQLICLFSIIFWNVQRNGQTVVRRKCLSLYSACLQSVTWHSALLWTFRLVETVNTDAMVPLCISFHHGEESGASAWIHFLSVIENPNEFSQTDEGPDGHSSVCRLKTEERNFVSLFNYVFTCCFFTVVVLCV